MDNPSATHRERAGEQMRQGREARNGQGCVALPWTGGGREHRCDARLYYQREADRAGKA